MTQSTDTPADAAAADATGAPAGGQKPGSEPLGEPGLKALQAERDARAKAESDLAALRKEIEDGKKSAEEKAADDLRAAQALAADATAKALRYEVAAAKGIPLALAGRLTGATKAEIEADADALKALIPETKAGNPKPDLSQGGGGGGGEKSSVSRGRELYAERHKKK